VSRFERTGWREMPSHALIEALSPGMKTYQKEVADGHLSVFVGPEPEGFHLSISHRTNETPPKPGRYPTWDEIVEARYEFCPAQMLMAMLLPPKEEYVNVHPTTFHLWEMER
jgi:hypothetical protein